MEHRHSRRLSLQAKENKKTWKVGALNLVCGKLKKYRRIGMK